MIGELVSVRSPVYDAEKFIEDRIDSALNQKYKKVEYIVIDNCSSDYFVENILHLAKEYPEIECHKLKKNTGMDFAGERYIVFLSSGDYCKPEGGWNG